MSKPKSSNVAQKKKRLVQLRDAQRRRRERLRGEKQHFVQIILPENTLRQLSRIIEISGETMQQVIARLVHSSLPTEPGGLPAEPDIQSAPDIVSAEEISGESVPEEMETVIEELAAETLLEPEQPEEMEAISETPDVEEMAEAPDPIPEEKPAPAKIGQLDLFG